MTQLRGALAQPPKVKKVADAQRKELRLSALPQAPDSLVALLRQPTLPDTTRINALARLGDIRRQTDLAESRRLNELGLRLARRHHYLYGELNCLLNLFNTVASARQYVQAEQLAQQALKLSEQAPPRLQFFRVRALQDLAGVSNSVHDDFRRAGYYYRQALAVAKHLRPARPRVLGQVLAGLASYYVNRLERGEATDSVQRLATYYARLALHSAQAQHDAESIGDGLVSLGMVARNTGQLDSAAYFMKAAVQQFQQQAQLNSAAFAWLDLALIQTRQGKFAAAAAAGRQAQQLATQVQDARTQAEACLVLGHAYAGQGNYRQAYEAIRKVPALNDSLNALANSETLNKLQVAFDTERKESRIRALTQQQQQQRQQLLLLAAVLLAVIAGTALVVVLALRLRRSQARLASQNEELTHTRAAQDQLYALVAHDLRSPVVAFTGLADLLHRYVQRQDVERLASLGGHIRQSAQKLSELLDNLLNWALSQRGELVPAPQPLHVQALLTELADLYQYAAQAAGINLVVEAPPGLTVLADPDMTRTILRNLVSNALQATPTDGCVTLSTWQQAGKIHLQVTDTGAGLTPEALHELAAADTPLRVAHQQRGAGLGLLLSRLFAKAQAGELCIINVADGPGVQARLLLPMAY